MSTLKFSVKSSYHALNYRDNRRTIETKSIIVQKRNETKDFL